MLNKKAFKKILPKLLSIRYSTSTLKVGRLHMVNAGQIKLKDADDLIRYTFSAVVIIKASVDVKKRQHR
jgi:hypothetical protein